MAKLSLPRPSLEHLHRLTDDTGLFQHAKFTIPLRSEGYTTDDNTRALIVATKYCARCSILDAGYSNRETNIEYQESRMLLDRYLAFVLDACNKDGTVRNFMDFDRSWHKAEPVNDAIGRAIWSFGELMAQPPSEIYVPIAQERIDIAMPLIRKQYPRGMAYSILGLAGYLKQFPDADDVKNCMVAATDSIVSRFEKNMKPDWPWFENILTYDNAMLPCALFTAGVSLGSKKYIEIAKQICDFLLAQTFTAWAKAHPTNAALTTGALGTGHFSFIGCNGWFPRGGKKAQFDQQPIEAAGTILMLDAGYKATKDKKYLALRQKAFNWFLGENDIGIPLYDSKSKGCGDGLGEGGVSANQGAESTISFLLGLLTMLEGHNS